MKTRPILFSGEMVKAILDGRKTMTRRVIKPQPNELPNGNLAWRSKSGLGFINFGSDALLEFCLYGQPGDRLWVREAWDFLPFDFGKSQNCEIAYWATNSTERRMAPADFNPVIYSTSRLRPSIHMPRWASRITLEITAVRVERVQEISEGDAKAEGIKETREGFQDGVQGFIAHDTAVSAFITLWDSINAKRGFGWNVNPWCWVIEFKRIVAGGEA